MLHAPCDLINLHHFPSLASLLLCGHCIILFHTTHSLILLRSIKPPSLYLSIRECATYVVKKPPLYLLWICSLYLYMCSISASLRSCHWNTWFSRSAKCISSCVIKCPVSPLLQVLLPANSKLLVLVLVDGKCDSLLFVHTLIVSIFFGRCKKVFRLQDALL
jgi:hypothetical protein